MTKTEPSREPVRQGLRYLDGRIEPTLGPAAAQPVRGPDSRVEPRLGLPIAPRTAAPR